MSDAILDHEARSPEAIRGSSLSGLALRRLMRNPGAVLSLYLVAILALVAGFGPTLWVHSYTTIFPSDIAIAPTFRDLHLFGTDAEGRDMVARTIFGLRISLLVALAATGVALTVGVVWGAIAGFSGGLIDALMMRIVDALHPIPFIFFAIVLMTVVHFDDPVLNLVLIFCAIAAGECLTMARIVRAQTLAWRGKAFVEAARASGARPLDIVLRHIAPNVLGPVFVFATLNIPVLILAESFLSFIGFGVHEPMISLGSLLAGGRDEMQAPWVLIAPAATLFITLLALNLLGDGLKGSRAGQ
jgi:oligopeptide transport system permease protein